MLLFKLSYWIAMIAELLIRTPFAINKKSQRIIIKTNDKRESILTGLLSLTMLPTIIYTFTNQLSLFDYSMPDWMGWLGMWVLSISLLIFWRSHYDLKNNWSATIRIYEEQKLITTGIYKYLRHPMYLSQILSSIAQIFLMQNWLAGPIRLLLILPYYFLRKNIEERMLEERFKEQYINYREQTGVLFRKRNK
jgi:protein-S-isoprenylcysteine O-methyltransferase Ste14